MGAVYWVGGPSDGFPTVGVVYWVGGPSGGFPTVGQYTG